MASKEPQVMGLVRTQDLSVSWISESGMKEKNTDRVCILTMANGQIRLTMQAETLNLKGMRLTKGHICVFALFEACDTDNGEAADKASEIFMNEVMKHDITKKPAADILNKCLSKADKAVQKGTGKGYKASIAAFAAKELTACCINGARMLIMHDKGNIVNFTSNDVGMLAVGTAWKNIMMVSDGYPVVDSEIKEDMHWPTADLVTKKGLRTLPGPSSAIRVQRI
jgi:hypothetical protein